MTSICNDDWASLGVMSGHERKTLRLSDTMPLKTTPADPAELLVNEQAIGACQGRCRLCVSCNDGFALGIERDWADGRPITGGARPARWVQVAGLEE